MSETDTRLTELRRDELSAVAGGFYGDDGCTPVAKILEVILQLLGAR